MHAGNLCNSEFLATVQHFSTDPSLKNIQVAFKMRLIAASFHKSNVGFSIFVLKTSVFNPPMYCVISEVSDIKFIKHLHLNLLTQEVPQFYR